MTYRNEIWGFSLLTQRKSFDRKIHKSVLIFVKEPIWRDIYIISNQSPCPYETLSSKTTDLSIDSITTDYFGAQQARHNYNTRFSCKKNLNKPPFHRSKYKRFFFLYQRNKHENNFSRQLKLARPKHYFKGNLGRFLFYLLHVHWIDFHYDFVLILSFLTET